MSTSTPPADERATALLGTIIDDRFRLEERIGAGGLGEVFRAQHLRMERSFAIKLLQPSVARQSDFVQRFDREAKALSRLSHPYCVEVTDYGVSAEHGPYIAMELLEGAPLSRLTRPVARDDVARDDADGEANLRLGDALELCRKVLVGLEHAHAQGIAHRDLKPDNIMVVADPVRAGEVLPKILDFGLAKIHAGDGETSALTQAGLIIGTPYYMAPERIATPQSADAVAGDLYALGVLLYEICCGQRPFVGPDTMATLTLQMTAEPRPPRELVPGLPTALEALILRALEKRPADRFSSAQELRESLEALLPLEESVAALPCGAAAHVSAEAETVSAQDISGSPRNAAAGSTAATASAASSATFGSVAGAIVPPATTTSTRVERPLTPPRASAAAEPARRLPIWALALGGVGLLAAGVIITLALVLDDGPQSSSRRGPRAGSARAAVGEARGPHASDTERSSSATPMPGRWAQKAGLARELKRAARLWPRRERRAVRLFGRYLARHRNDARGHLFVARLYLLRLWAGDGVQTLEYALAADPTLKLDDATLVGLAFAYRSKRRARARELLLEHAGKRASRVLLTAAAAIRDKDLCRRQLEHAAQLGVAAEELDRALLTLANKVGCKDRKRALAAVVSHRDPLVDVLLSLLRERRCLGRSARRYRRGRR
jgi:serine/threonine protein kinase